MPIKHLHCLTDDHAKIVEGILQAALQAADPRAALTSDAVQRALDLPRIRRLRVVSIGKAAHAMTRGLLDVFGDRIDGGFILAKHAETGLPERFHTLIGDHPVPGQNSVSGARALLDFLSGGQPGDVVIFLISGGGSALMTLPVDGVTLEDMQDLTRLLLACGATIEEMNILRKHLDQVKGGRLAQAAAPARFITFILSDVIGSPLDVIASGPTVPDSSTYADALAVIDKYSLMDRIPASIRQVLVQGARGERVETLKAGDPLLDGALNQVVSSNLHAAQAALAQARAEGLNALLLTSHLQGEASQVGQVMAAVLKQIDKTGQPLARPACIIAGGETTVTLRGKGLGGRNQELALAAVPLLDGIPNAALLAFGTDGEDGPTGAAGAVVTGETLSRARAAGLNPAQYLSENDSYHFFQQLDQLIITGPTGTNVNDLTFLFAF